MKLLVWTLAEVSMALPGQLDTETLLNQLDDNCEARVSLPAVSPAISEHWKWKEHHFMSFMVPES